MYLFVKSTSFKTIPIFCQHRPFRTVLPQVHVSMFFLVRRLFFIY